MKKSFIYFVLLALLLPLNSVGGQQKVTTQAIDWSSFLSKHDMFWSQITTDYYAGAIMGNGLIGNNIYKDGQNYRFHVGRVDVTEGRSFENNPAYHNLYDAARLPIGHFLLKPVGTTTSENMRLSLWDAVTNGRVTTNRGAIAFKTYVHSNKDVIIIETTAEGDEVNFGWDWVALKAISPRYVFYPTRPDRPADYLSNPNPDVKISTDGDYLLSVQNLYGGKTYVVACKEVKQDNKRRIMITISQEDNEALAISNAKQTIEDAWQSTSESLENSHKNWWHDYYPSSFATFSNHKMESFYWIQQYKYACVTRPDKFIIDLQGPWAVQNTPWPGIWMNLNIQLTYSSLFAGNRAEMSKPVWKSMSDNLQSLIDNVYVEAWKADAAVLGRHATYDLYAPLFPDNSDKTIYEVGNLTWLLYHYYEYCDYSGDDTELLTKFYPLLKRAIAYYEHIRELRADGKYHLPTTGSPEYGVAKDCNYDLSVLRWGLSTLMKINTTHNLNDPKAADWLDFDNKLVNYPQDVTRGYMIGENVNLTSSHRHYSHLLMIYPLYTVNWEQTANRDLITKSLTHWQSMTSALQGYSFTGSSSMYSMMGDGQMAVAQLQKLIDGYIQKNTLYKESGPVIETPFAAVTSLHEMYLQSWGDKIRVFPALPAGWRQASFINMRTSGAFLVSASREESKTVFIQVESEKGGMCRLQTAMSNIVVKNLSGQNVPFTIVDAAAGLIEVSTAAGDVFQVTDSSTSSVLPAPISHPRAEANPYGVNTGPVFAVEGISISESEVILSKSNPSVTLTAIFTPTDATNRNVMWKSSNENVVTVNKQGGLSPVSKGTAVITVTSEDGGFTATCSVTVSEEIKTADINSVAIADSFVQGSNNAEIFGANNPLIMRFHSSESNSYWRSPYFKFSLDEIHSRTSDASSIVDAQFSVYVESYNTGTLSANNTWVLQAVGNDWTEAGLMFNNKPAVIKDIATTTAPAAKTPEYKLFDVADYIREEYLKGATEISFRITSYSYAGDVIYRITSRDGDNAVNRPAIKYLIVENILSGTAPNLTSDVSVYPAITDGIVTINIKDVQPIRLISSTGVVLKSIAASCTGENQIDLTSYPSGIYLIKVGNSVHRIIRR